MAINPAVAETAKAPKAHSHPLAAADCSLPGELEEK
jgi:hypothetical protein